MSTNPLQKYFRQPKIFVSLPSKGLYYKPDTLNGDPSNVPIFAMTGMDEIIMKTPDALFSGEASIKLIESCCPYITNASEIPSLDIDVLLIAIRLATFGENLTIEHTCSSCKETSEFEVKLPLLLEHYNNKTFSNQLHIDDLVINLRPLTYTEMTKINIENFKLQKMLGQIDNADTEDRQRYLDQIYQQLADIQVDMFLNSIESIQTPDAVVSKREFIQEWLKNSVSESYKKIKTKLEENRAEWEIPKLPVKCDECGHEDQVSLSLDQASFFGRD